MPDSPKRKRMKQKHRVYCTYLDNGQYYIGYSGKTDKQYETYFGSSKKILAYEGNMHKETIAVYEIKSHAKMQEFLLQWQQRRDSKCLNNMFNVRLKTEYLEDFEPVKWHPKQWL